MAFLTLHLSNHNHKQVVYDNVETNLGSCYNTTTGLFTVPVDGTYVFIWHAVADTDGSGYCHLLLYRNGAQRQITAFADSRGSSGGTDAASNSAVLTLNTGDTVGIRTGDCGYLYGREFTSFSGFKIWSMILSTIYRFYEVNDNKRHDINYVVVIVADHTIDFVWLYMYFFFLLCSLLR